MAVFQAGRYEDDLNDNTLDSEGDWTGDREFISEGLLFAFRAGTYAAAIDALFQLRHSVSH